MTTHTEVQPPTPKRRGESAYAQAIRQAAFENARLALGDDGIRWVEALMRLQHDDDLNGLAIDEFEEAVRVAVAAMNALPETELNEDSPPIWPCSTSPFPFQRRSQ